MSPAEGKITAEDLLDTLAAADALETFLHLPREEQDRFALWIGRSRDDKSAWRRIHALVLAIRMGPFHVHLDRRQAQGS